MELPPVDINAVPEWLRRPFPSIVFSMANLLSPALFPMVGMFILTYSNFERRADMVTAKMDQNFANQSHFAEYDFIVVGGGSAGSVLANRLSLNNKVLLLEAGGNPNPLSVIPAFEPVMITQPSIDWQYQTVPQKNAAFGFLRNRAVLPRGKSLGGSSVLNAMLAVRSNPNDYNNWAKITGDDSWEYEKLLPFFRKLETYAGNYPDDHLHGNSGPIYVERMGYGPAQRELLLAAQEMGYRVGDMNGYQTEGFMPSETTSHRGRRADTYRSYIRPITSRKNLITSRYSHAYKIHLERETKRAYGVSYIRHGVNKFARATKEVIVSAGAMNSPHLLMLSGIGPRKHLNETGIRCRVNLPVGQNLQDHPMTVTPPLVLNQSLTFIPDRNLSIYSGFKYLLNGQGILSSVPAATTGFISTSDVDPSWPNVLVHQLPVSPHKGSGPLVRTLEQIFGFRADVLASLLEESEGKDAFVNIVALGRPMTRGEITLNSKDPLDKPLIDPKYLKDPRDAVTMVEGVKEILNIFQSAPTFRRLGATMVKKPIKFCEDKPFGTDAYWECYVRTFTMSLYHQCCTCPMGKSRNDTRAVTDSQFRVVKTRNLRVIDASSMPIIPNGNINIPTIMMGEKGAFVVRDYWAAQFLICPLFEYTFTLHYHLKCFYSRHV